jgi:hypothetical protein
MVPLGFLIRRAGTEPSKVNRMCLWSDSEGSEETSQALRFPGPHCAHGTLDGFS